MGEKPPFFRVRIEGEMTTRSPLHCGDGQFLSRDDWPCQRIRNEGEKHTGKGSINTVCKDGAGKPYIPASTLRGSLRAMAPAYETINPADERGHQDERGGGAGKLGEALFGTAKGLAKDDQSLAGKLRFYDARWLDGPEDAGDCFRHDHAATTLIDGVAIDPITQTAQEHKLYSHEVVPAGTRFSLDIEGDGLSRAELSALLAILAAWNGDAASALGKGKTKGWGRIVWTGSPRVSVIDEDDLKAWMNCGDTRLDSAYRAYTPVVGGQCRKSQQWSIGYRLTLQSPLLINQSNRIRSKPSGPTEGSDKIPDLEFTRDKQGNAYIPGSSLRGAVRAHASRILATVAHQHYGVDAGQAREKIRPLVEALFGSTGKRSVLWFGDARAESTAPHSQMFNAVDRFTGGVATTALYHANAVAPTTFTGVCTLDIHRQRLPAGDWWKGLLCLVARDFMEGDLALGWGKAKGYGSAVVSFVTEREALVNDVESLKTEAGADISLWLIALHETVAAQVNEENRL